MYSESKDMLETLEGCEIISSHFEGCVGISGGQVWRDGKVIDPKPSPEVIGILFDEYCEQEGIDFEL